MKKLTLIFAAVTVMAAVSSCDLSLSSQLNRMAFPADNYFSLDKQLFEFDVNYDIFYAINVQGDKLYLLLIKDYSSYFGSGDFYLYTMSTNGNLLGVQFLSNFNVTGLAYTVTADYVCNKQFSVVNSYLYYYNNDFFTLYNISNDTVVTTLEGLDSCYIYNNSDIYIVSNKTKFYHFKVNAFLTSAGSWDIPSAGSFGDYTVRVISDNTNVYISRNYTDITRTDCGMYSMTGTSLATSDSINLLFDFVNGAPAELTGAGMFSTFDSSLQPSTSYGFASSSVDGFEIGYWNACFPNNAPYVYVTAESYSKGRIYRYRIPE